MFDPDEELRKIIEASLMGPMGKPPADTSGDLPRGTKVNFAEPELETAAPSRRVIQPREIPPEKVVQVPGNPAAPDDMELALARAQDRQARSSDAFDRGGRQLLAGLTRTPVQDTMRAPSDAVAQLLAKRKANDATHQGNEQIRLGAARMAYDKAQAEAKALEDKARDTRDFEYGKDKDASAAERQKSADEETKRNHLATEANGRISALKPSGAGGGPLERDADGNLVPKTIRDALRVDAIKPRPGWEKIDPAAQAFRDPQQAKAFDDAAAAFGALQNHRAHAATALRKLHAAKTPAEADTALAEVNQQMANIASKLRVAEGLNSSDASNHAVDTMLSLSNGSIANVRNMANEGRLDAILDSAIASAGTNLDTLAGSANLRRSKAAAKAERPRKVKEGVTYERGDDGMWDPVEE